MANATSPYKNLPKLKLRRLCKGQGSRTNILERQSPETSASKTQSPWQMRHHLRIKKPPMIQLRRLFSTHNLQKLVSPNLNHLDKCIITQSPWQMLHRSVTMAKASPSPD